MSVPFSQKYLSHEPRVVLVTGASGFVGTNVVRMLLGKGVKVRAAVRNKSKCTLAETKDLEIRVGDIEDKHFVRELVHDVDSVVHTAAYVSDFALDRSVYYRVNVESSANLVNEMVRESASRKIRLVDFSTVDVLRFAPNEVVDDASPYEKRPQYDYPKSKIQSKRKF
jgi:dihydroflavonol-4-reductase